MTTLVVSDSPKMIREALCRAQTGLGYLGYEGLESEIQIIQRLINECDRHRPIGPDGKHGNRHTPTCGCEP